MISLSLVAARLQQAIARAAQSGEAELRAWAAVAAEPARVDAAAMPPTNRVRIAQPAR